MKKIISILAIMLLFLLPQFAMAAGTVTQTYTKVTNDVSCLTYTWTAAAGGSLTSTASTVAINGYVILVVTNPGDTAPTASYSITLTDADSCDVMGGTLASRSATATEHAVPKIGDVYGGRWVSGILTLNLTGNSISSATGTVAVYIQR